MKMLKPAENKAVYAKVGLYGDAGSGKTFTAAQLAIGLYQYAKLKKPVGMFDTEPAASYIKPLFDKAGIEFLVYDESRALKDLMDFMDEAEKECSVVIVDSITHIWRDAQDSFLKKINASNKKKAEANGWVKKWKPIYQLEFHHWKPIKAAWHTFTDRFLASKLHMIVCGRAGSIYEYQKNEDTGKMELITIGTKMATEKELGYEPSLLIEMVKHRESGHIINRALVEKDRTDSLNGREIDSPTFEKLKAHFAFLNLTGQACGSMTQRDSSDLYDEEGNDNWSREKRAREIECEEIKNLLIKHNLDGNGAEAKKKRVDLLEQAFCTASWTKIENMASEGIRDGRDKLTILLAEQQQAA